jgi:DNA-binding MarR family transcriptional regulator
VIVKRPVEEPAEASRTAPFRGLAFTLSSLGYAVSRRFKEALVSFDLHPREFALLRAVASDEGESQQTLAERLQIPRSRMVAIVDELERRSLLERRASPQDRRVRLLHLTDAGRALLRQALARAIDFERELGAPLAPDEREQLLDLLERLAPAIGLTPGRAHPALGGTTDDEHPDSND